MVIEILSVQFARYGILDIFMSDNGLEFINDSFKCFMKKWNIHCITSLPHHPQSNGKVENAVKTCKILMKKAEKSRSDIRLPLLDYRNTPSEGTCTSPAQRLFGRRTQILLPIATTLLQPESAKDTTKLIKIAKFKQQEIFNRIS